MGRSEFMQVSELCENMNLHRAIWKQVGQIVLEASDGVDGILVVQYYGNEPPIGTSYPPLTVVKR